MRFLAVLIVVAWACSGTSTSPATSPPSGASTAKPSPCKSYSTTVLTRAFQWHAGRALPVVVSVDERSGIHLTFTGDSLSPEVASILASFPMPHWGPRFLEFPRLASLDRGAAEQLANWKTTGTEFELHLVMPALQTMDDDVAAALSEWDGSRPSRIDRSEEYYEPESSIHLHLDGLETLSAHAARWLLGSWPETRLRSSAHLYLPSLGSLPTDEHEFFDKPEGRLTLSIGVTSYTKALAEALSRLSIRELRLDRVTTLDSAAAKRIATFPGDRIRIDNLESLDASSAGALARWPGRLLSLSGLKTLDVATATRLVDWNRRDKVREADIAKRLRAADNDNEPEPAIEGPMPTLEEQIRDAIAALYNRRLELHGLRPSKDLVAAFEAWAGPANVFVKAKTEQSDWDDPAEERGCDLSKVTSAAISNVASRIDEEDGDTSKQSEMVLGALAAYSPLPPAAIVDPSPTATELVALQVLLSDDPSQTALSLDEVERVDASIVSAAARGEHVALQLPSISDLSVDEARAVAGWPGSRLVLPGLKALHPHVAPVLTQWKGDALLLNGLVELDDVVAAVLARWPGDKLELDGLRVLHPQVAAALSQWSGTKLELDGLVSIELDAATELAKWKGKKLELDGLQTVDAATASALATFRGRLELDGLRYLSPAALTALIKGPAQALLDGRPISLNTSLGGAVVPDAADAHLAQLVGIPVGSYVFSESQTLTSHGDVLTARTARLIAKQTLFERVDLNSVRTLGDGAAKELAAWPGSSLRLDGLATLDEATARSLARWKGDELSLGGLKSLSKEAVTALSTWKGYTLELAGIERMDRATLAKLASRGASIAVHQRLVVPRTMSREQVPDVTMAPSFYSNENPRHVIELDAPR